jgi:ketosteroid isomerase-like protein
VLDGFRLDVERVVGCGDVAVTQVRYSGTVKQTGRSFDVQAALIWDVRDGKLIRNREYLDTLQFMNAWQASD